MALSGEKAYTIKMLCSRKDILNKFVEGHHCKKLAPDYPVHTTFLPNLLGISIQHLLGYLGIPLGVNLA
jgi:hypothetical protein